MRTWRFATSARDPLSAGPRAFDLATLFERLERKKASFVGVMSRLRPYRAATCRACCTQGVALGSYIVAPSGRFQGEGDIAPKGQPDTSPGQRPGYRAHILKALKGRNGRTQISPRFATSDSWHRVVLMDFISTLPNPSRNSATDRHL